MITPTKWQQMKEIIADVCSLAPTERNAYLLRVCAGDEELRREVDAFLSNEEHLNNFLQSPLVDVKELFPVQLSHNDQNQKSQALEQPNNIQQHSRPAMLNNLINQVIDSKYSINKQLGQGGMGAVFLATHLGTGRPVAVKVITPQFMANEVFVERFKREARAAGLLRHPNVINVTDFGFATVTGQPLAYLVMEYLNGCTLGELLKQQGRLPLSFVVDVVEQVCLAMNEAHKQGIIHRDLKPDNIWLEPNGRGGYNVKVLDFGLAKLRNTPLTIDKSIPVETMAQPDSKEAVTQVCSSKIIEIDSVTETQERDLTRAGTIMGTPLYMSPEQCSGGELDARADIYSLGVIVYQMLAGETPFKGSLNTLIQQHNETLPPSIREKCKDIPEVVEDLIMAALAKKVEDRPVSAMAFATALRTVAGGELPLLQDAFDYYRRHSASFRIISLSTNSIFFLLALITFFLLSKIDWQHTTGLSVFHQWCWLALFPIFMFANTVESVAIAIVVAQLQKGSIEPISSTLRLTFGKLKKLALTAIENLLEKIIKPYNLFTKHSGENLLYPVIVGIEDKHKHKALIRSRELLHNVSFISLTLKARELFFTSVIISIFLGLITLFSFLTRLINRDVIVPEMILAALALCLTFVVVSFYHPILSITRALIYFRTLRIIGEDEGNQQPKLKDLIINTHHLPHISYRKMFVVAIGFLFVLGSWPILQNRLMMYAAKTGCSSAVSILSTLGADPNGSDNSMHRLPLLAAIAGNYPQTVKTLLASGSNPNLVTINGTYSIGEAAKNPDIDINIIRMLVTAGADINFSDAKGWTPLMYALDSGSEETALELIRAGADTNTRDKNSSYTPTLLAIARGKINSLKKIISNGAQLNKDNIGNVGLLMAAQDGKLDVVKQLVLAGVNINNNNNNGHTPLMLAAQRGHGETVKFLLTAGASIEAKNESGETALMLATQAGNNDVVRMILAETQGLAAKQFKFNHNKHISMQLLNNACVKCHNTQSQNIQDSFRLTIKKDIKSIHTSTCFLCHDPQPSGNGLSCAACHTSPPGALMLEATR